MSQLAADHKMTLVAGSIAERVPDSEKICNTSLVFGPDGQQLGKYRKMHLFEVDMPGKVSFCEADIMLPGNEVVVSDIAARASGPGHLLRPAVSRVVSPIGGCGS